MKRLLLICGTVAALLAPTASAGGGGSVTVNNPYPILWGDTVTFTYSTNVANPVLRFTCGDRFGSVALVVQEGPASGSFLLATSPMATTDGFCRVDLGSYNNHGAWKRVAWQQFQIYISPPV